MTFRTTHILRISLDDDAAFASASRVASVEAAATAARERRPDVLAIDLVGDGAATLDAIRREPTLKDVPVLAIVPRGSEPAWADAADALLARPFDAAELRSVVRLLRRTRRVDPLNDYRSLFDVIDEGFCIIDMVFDADANPIDYRIVDYNAAYEQFTGLQGSRGKLVTEVAPGLERHWFERYGNVARSGESARFVQHARVLHDRWFDVRAFRMGGPGSVRVAILFSEITDRRRAEASVAGTEQRLRTITDNIPALVAHVDAEQRYTFVNAAYERMLDQPAALMIGRTIRDVVGATAHEMRREQIEATLRDGKPITFEGRLPIAGRAEMYTLTSYVPERGAAGTITGMYIFAIDISDRIAAERLLRESEARFRTIADTMPQIIWVTRSDGHHEYFSRRWYEYVGTTQGENDGHGWANPLHPDDRDAARARWQQSLDTGEPYEIEYRFRRHDGAYRWFLGLALPARDDAGQILRWYGTLTDIDDQRRLRDERDRLLASERLAREETERASRLKDEFLATLSHELRTPLSAMLGWSQVLQRSSKPDDIRAGLATIERNARAQSQIIEDLLDMSRIVGGKIRLDVQPVDLAAVCEAAIDTVRPAADGRDIRIQPVLDPSAGPVNGDPARLQQVLWNLLSNAVKFTPKGGRVGVVLSRVNSHVEIRVSDTGEGIAPTFLPFVFDRFRQADGSSTRRHGGLGIGLSICKQLVELHGGTIRVDSAGSGKGSTFTVALPLNAVLFPPTGDDDRRHPRAADALRAPAEETDLTGLTILVVDDEPDARELASHVLSSRGATVATAQSAADALAQLGDRTFNLMVSDVGMPEMDGHGLIRQLRQRPADRGGQTPAIALTAYATADDRVRAFTAGFQMHLSKPVEPTELIAAAAAIARRRSR